MEREALKLVIVGSVDHGKSTLIGRLFYDTGSLPEGKMEELRAAAQAEGKEVEFAFIMDHLREEREGAMTIDTAQAFFSGALRDYVIIDAPGHKELLKNMVTGASQADGAVLICSAYEGVEEQTRRHAYVLKLLGLHQTIVAYNKMDLVEYDQRRFEKVRTDLREFLQQLGIEPRLEIPISAKLGENVAQRSLNMPWYEGATILEALDTFELGPGAVEKPVRFPVQDVYELDGRKVAVGRIESGVLSRGAELLFLPAAKRRTVADILRFEESNIEQGTCGECIGVALEPAEAQRGEIGCDPNSPPRPVRSFEASIFWLAHGPLNPGEELVIHCSTQEAQSRIAVIRERIDSSTLECLERNAKRLEETEVGQVTVTCDRPLVVEKFTDVPELGRFVLVRGRNVVAGGIVTGTTNSA